MDLTFSARHKGISVWVLKQRVTSIAKPLRENTTALVLLYTPSAKVMKIICADQKNELKEHEQKQLMAKLKSEKYLHLIFSLRHLYCIDFELP